MEKQVFDQRQYNDIKKRLATEVIRTLDDNQRTIMRRALMKEDRIVIQDPEKNELEMAYVAWDIMVDSLRSVLDV